MPITKADLKELSQGFSGVFFDLESGGFDAKTCGITEVAAYEFIISGDGSLSRPSSCSYLIAPIRDKHYTAKALEVQNRTLEGLEEHGGGYEQAVVGMKDYFVSLLGLDWAGKIWAHNAPFDFGFMKKAFSEYCPDIIMPERSNWSDTKHLILTMRQLGYPVPEANNMKVMAEHFGVTTTGQHSAEVDVLISIEVLARLMEIIRNDNT